MNRHCHRVIFNARRGVLMAVAETTASCGKRAAGESAAPRAFTWTMAASLFLLSPAGAQVIADPNAPATQRPTILSDSLGRPLIHIQTPNAQGLSRNTYRQFDVPTIGVVLNNSASNPWIASKAPATTILNEVNSASRSYINGPVTVLGAPAQVIVANPNGITISGGRFINTTRATLTTGTARIHQGVLQGFDVRGGTVVIGEGGLNSSATPFTDILSRAAQITGKVSAQNLQITTGKQLVANDTGQTSEHDTTPNTSATLAIDTSSLGGMYANRITLLATEAGLGVRNQGTWQASGGQIIVTADGRLQNLGTITAKATSLATTQGHVENKGTLRGAELLAVSAGNDFRQYGTGMAQTTASTVLVNAKGHVILYSTEAEGAAAITSNAAGGRVSLGAGKNISMQNGSRVTAHGHVELAADGAVTLNGASATSATGGVLAVAGTGMTLTNATVTGAAVHLETGAPFQETDASISITGGKVRGSQQTTLLATRNVTIASPGSTSVSSAGHVHIQADKAVTVAAGTTVAATRSMSVIAGTHLSLQGEASPAETVGKKVTLSAGENLLAAGNSVTATGSLLKAGQALDIEAYDGDITLRSLSNAGGAHVERAVLRAGTDLNVGAAKGSLWATGIDARGANVSLMSTRTTSVPESSDLKTQINTLAKQPGTTYLADLALRKDVNWRPVKLAHDSWDYRQQGLTPGGAAIVAAVVAWVTGGAGASLVGAQAGTTTALVANAAFTSLASQAAIAFINSGGDIGKTLKALGSSQSVKATIAAALTAGVLDKLGSTQAMQDLARQGGLGEKLTFNLINASGRALTNTAISGGDLQQAFKDALLGGVVDTLHGQAASHIKGLESDYLAHKLAHALAGCAAGAATGGTCKDGAIGGPVGEMVAELFKGTKPLASASAAEIDAYNQKVLGYSKIVAGAVSAYAGGNAQTAITTAETALRNNFLTDQQWNDFSQKLQACKGNTTCEAGARAEYLQLSKLQDAQLATCDARGDCNTLSNNVLQGRNAMLQLVNTGQLPIAYAGALDMQYLGQRLANDATFRKQVGNAVEYMNWCTANASACNKDQLQKAAGLGVLVLGPVIAANPQLVAAFLFAQNGERAGSAVIGGGVNALAQGLSSGKFKPEDVLKAAATAYVTAGASLVTTTAVNVGAEGLVSWARDDSASETMSNMLLSAVGTGIGYKAGDFGKTQADKIWHSYKATMISKPTGLLTIEGPYKNSLWPSSIGSGLGGVIGEKISTYNSEITIFLAQFHNKREQK